MNLTDRFSQTRWSVGSLLFLLSWAVLMGPLVYAKHLISGSRLPFTAAYFGSIALTLYFAIGVSLATIFVSSFILLQSIVGSSAESTALHCNIGRILFFFSSYTTALTQSHEDLPSCLQMQICMTYFSNEKNKKQLTDFCYYYALAPLHPPHPHLVHLPTRRANLVFGQLLPHGQHGVAVHGSVRSAEGVELGDQLIGIISGYDIKVSFLYNACMLTYYRLY